MPDQTGRFIVGRYWGRRWSVQDQSWNPPKVISTHDTETEARAAATHRNHPAAPRTEQPTLFEETT